MARLEEAEHGDLDKAREWLMRAGEALPDPAWVCDSCGALASEWQPRCGACDAYDGLAWHTPPRVPIAVAAAAELVTPEAPEAPEAETAAILPAEPVEVVTNGGDSTRRQATERASPWRWFPPRPQSMWSRKPSSPRRPAGRARNLLRAHLPTQCAGVARVLRTLALRAPTEV
jgi:uncharacterized membrane-anchored protein